MIELINNPDNTIYLDSAASTKPTNDVLNDIYRSLSDDWHNPSSVYEEGLEVWRKIDNAKKQVLRFINGKSEDKIIFTSCGTESNNLAIRGYIDYLKERNRYFVFITDETQHPSVYNPSKLYNSFGESTMYCMVDNFGRLNLKDLNDLLSINAHKLVSVLMVNNELGTINDIRAISDIVHRHGGTLHVDACQAAYHIPIDVQELNIDMLTFTSEKIGMPRGCGVLYVRDGIEIVPQMLGGKQNDGLRAGTENQYMIVALGNQCDRIRINMKDIMLRERTIYYKMRHVIHRACDGICDYKINTIEYNDNMIDKIINTIPSIISVRFCNYDNQLLLSMLADYGVLCSAGSACSSGEAKPSRVLKAIGLSDDEALSTLRFSFDYSLENNDIIEFSKILKKCLTALK